jgi:hypothetical protein
LFISTVPERNNDRKDGELCKHCTKNFDFAQFASGKMNGLHGVPRNLMGSTTTVLLSLFDIIKNSGSSGLGCPFCNLLLNAMKMPEHDPFLHPAIKYHRPDGFPHKTFSPWVEGLGGKSWLKKKLNDTHPFGKSRNKVQIKLDKDEIIEVSRPDLEKQQQAALATSAAGAGAGITAASQSKSEAQTAVSAVGGVGGIVNSARLIFLSGQLPVAVRVKMHNITDAGRQGLLNVSVHGYGCRVQAPLSTLSSFSLRVASDYRQDGLGLYYGRIMSERVRVEEDCRLWLHNCCRNHGEQCDKPDWFKRLPAPGGEHFRLIEIDKSWNDMFRIVEVAKAVAATGEAPKYAALSYVWGEAGRNALNLWESNVAELRKRIPPKRLAKTVADAIKVTRRLGLSYLWVDSLCIIQKNPEQTAHSAIEWEARQSQLDQMGSIFGHAEVVIVAAGGEDANGGLAGISQPRTLVQLAREVTPCVNVLLAAQYDKTYGTWDTRAWTLQERLMSRRMLVFGQQYASFHCRHSVLREDMPAAHAGNGPPAMPHLSILEDRPEKRAKRRCDGSYVLLRSPYFDEYSKILEQYTWRKMTETTDAISAMRGLLDVLEDMKRLDGQPRDRRPTLHGLPEEFLDLALLWQPPAVKGTCLKKREGRGEEDVSFPSWSWAGWEVDDRAAPSSENGVAVCRDHTGIRFEQPFQVSGYDNMSLRKFIATGAEAEERVRSQVMWYKVMEGNLVPVNNSGLGVVCSEDAATWFFKDPLRLLNPGPSQQLNLLPNVPPGIRLDEQHLVCETQVRAFKLQQDKRHRPRSELLWTYRPDGTPVVAKELDVVEAEILDRDGEVVGHVIPTYQNLEISTTKDYHFILLSISQYWGNEKRIDVQGYSLYNVMMVEWHGAKKGFDGFATRVGLGKISKAAWRAEHVPNSCVILA